MKKLLLTLGGVILCLTAGAQAVTIGDFTYNFYTSGNAYVQKYNGTDTEVTIPATIMVDEVSKKVTGIGDGAFEGNTTIQKVHLSTNGRYTLSEKAFKGCTTLEVINWAQGSGANSTYTADGFFIAFYNIPKSAFEGCTSITSVSNRYSNKAEIASNAFKGCTKMTSFQANVSNVGENAFNGCSNLGTLRFKTLDAFSDNALAGIPTTTKVYVPIEKLSDEMLDAAFGGERSAIYGQLSLAPADGYKVLTSKFNINLNNSHLTVKYIKGVTVTASGIQVEYSNTPTKALPANTAVLAYSDGSYSFGFSVLTTPPTAYDNYLCVTTEETTLTPDANTDYYVYAAAASLADTNFTKLTEATNVAAGTGYIKVVNGEAITTNIKSVNAIRQIDDADAPAYNLAGQRVDSSVNGIIIKNGKKYVVK